MSITAYLRIHKVDVSLPEFWQILDEFPDGYSELVVQGAPNTLQEQIHCTCFPESPAFPAPIPNGPGITLVFGTNPKAYIRNQKGDGSHSFDTFNPPVWSFEEKMEKFPRYMELFVQIFRYCNSKGMNLELTNLIKEETEFVLFLRDNGFVNYDKIEDLHVNNDVVYRHLVHKWSF